jgi:hypothetical protein
MNPITSHQTTFPNFFAPILTVILVFFGFSANAHIEEMWRVQEMDGSTTFYAETYKSGHGTWDGVSARGGIALGTSTFSFTEVVFSLPTDAILIKRCFRIGGKGDRYLKVTVPITALIEGTYALTIVIPGTALDTVILEPECDFPSVLIDYTGPTFTTCPSNDTRCSDTLNDYTGQAVASDNYSTSVSLSQSPVAGTIISGTTTVTLTATDDLGNSSTCSFNVTTGGGGAMTVSISSDFSKLLLGYAPQECATLSTTVTGGVSPYSYSWSTSGTDSSEIVCPTSDASYNVSVSDVSGCSATDTISITVEDVSCGNGSSNKIRICKTNGRGKKRAICISINAVADHLANGATIGSCWSEKQSAGQMTLGDSEDEFELDLYPNPFTNQLLVDFVANKTEKMLVEAFDLNGRSLGTLFNGYVEQGASYYGSIDGTNFPSGVILIRFTSDSITKVVKVQHL